jgi:hypothetical protein
MTQRQEQATRTPGGSQTKTGQDERESMVKLITKMIHTYEKIIVEIRIKKPYKYRTILSDS